MKVRVDHLLLGLGLVVLLVGSLLAWRALRPEPEQAELEQGLERLRSKPTPGASKRPRFLRKTGTFSSAKERPEAREGWVEPQTPQAGDPGDLGPDEAVDNFMAVIAELEAAAADRRRLSKRERTELYNRATGSFTALSAWTDGNDPSDRAVIDDAYARMMALMRELELEPPRNDPDGSPLRR
jgi:hypothetical protein